MNITFDKALKQRVFQAVRGKVQDDTCPFCGDKITGKNFAGAAWVDGEFRMFNGNLTCLFGLADSGRQCNYNFKKSWWCSRSRNHNGPCALRPRWWNLADRWRFRGMK